MGMFSLKNFLAPFTNTVNLIAIIFVILLFAVFRFSSGRYQTTTIEPSVKLQESASGANTLKSLESLLDEKVDKAKAKKEEVREESPDIGSHQAASQNDSSLLKEMHSIVAAEKAPAQDRKEARSSSSETGKLDEVEKALGLKK